MNQLRERCIEKKVKKKLTSVSFMYVCVAENAELLVFFYFFLHLPHRQFSFRREVLNHHTPPPHSPTHPQTVINHKN